MAVSVDDSTINIVLDSWLLLLLFLDLVLHSQGIKIVLHTERKELAGMVLTTPPPPSQNCLVVEWC